MATWLRWLIAAGLLLAATAALEALASVWRQTGLATSEFAELLTTINEPVREYIAAHATTLPATAGTLYHLWWVTGLCAFAAAGFTANIGPRMTWCAWGSATLCMVWQATPEHGQALAAAVTVLSWTAASSVALGRRSPQGVLCNHITVQPPTVQADIHLPAPKSTLHPHHITGPPGPSLN